MSVLCLLSVALSIDSLTVGLTYGLRKVKIPFPSLIILFLCAFGILYTSVFLGQGLTHLLSEKFASLIGGGILVVLGSWTLFQKGKEILQEKEETHIPASKSSTCVFQMEIQSLGLAIQILKTPTLADFDGSGRITGLEAFMLGLALSLDSFGAGIGIGVLGFHPAILSAIVACMSIVFLRIGVGMGRRLAEIGWMHYISACAGMILIIMGFLRM